jgi:hypothetical protein
MTREDIILKITKIKIELAMSGYHDGWTILGLKERLTELELLLKTLTA